MENIQDGNGKNKSSTHLYITKLSELIYAGAKLVYEKMGIPPKSTKKKSKPGWEIRLDTQMKNLRKQAKIKKKGKTRAHVETKRNRQHQKKNNNTT